MLNSILFLSMPAVKRSFLSRGYFRFLPPLALGFLLASCLPAALAQQPQGKGGQSARELCDEGIKLQSEGRLKEAADCYRQAIQLNPKGGAYHNNLAVVLKDLGELEAAEKEARLALEIKPERANYHFNLGLILQRLKRYGEAKEQFEEAVKRNASDIESRYRLAETLFSLSEYDQAEKQVKMSILLKPEESRYRQLLGDIYMKLDRKEEALYEYKQVVSLSNGGQVDGGVIQRIDYLKQVLHSR